MVAGNLSTLPNTVEHDSLSKARQSLSEDLESQLEKSRAEVSKLQIIVMRSISAMRRPIKLAFKLQPTLEIPYPSFSRESFLRSEDQQTALKSPHLENDILLNSQLSLVEMHYFLETMETYDDPDLSVQKRDLQAILDESFRQIHAYKQDEWRHQALMHACIPFLSNHDSPRIIVSKHMQARENLKRGNPVTTLSIWLVLVLRSLCHLSRDRSNFVLRVIRRIVSLTQSLQGQGINLSDGIPTDIRNAESIFDLNPTLTKYMSCPQCRKLYHPRDFDAEKAFPPICTYKEVSGGPECGARLWKTESMQSVPRFVPRLTFIYQNFPNWLARFVSRPGIEDLLRRSLANIRGEPPSLIRDIWDGKVVRTFKDKEGNLFFHYSGSELRLLFGFGYDNFNPFHNKAGRKKASVGAIFLVCFNLPSQLRLLPENIFLVGIVPGPKQPSLTQLNHYIEPLVEDLRDFFEVGYLFPLKSDSHIVAKGVMFPGIMDIHAARQIFGLGSYQRKWFCTHCLLPVDKIDVIEPSQWDRWHTSQRHRGLMEIWKNSVTEEAREEIFEKTNLRWTVLSCLPYFDMKIMCIFDPMHAFQNLFRNLIENTWGMDVTEASGDGIFVGSRPASKKVVTNHELFNILISLQNYIRTANQELLSNTRRAPLWFLCERHELRRAGERVQPYRDTLVEFYTHSPDILENDINEFQAKPRNEAAECRKAIKAIRLTLALMDPLNHQETQNWLTTRKLDDLHEICQELHIEYELRERRSHLAGKLVQNQIINPLPMRSQDLPKGKPVLGKDEVFELNKDFARMSLPSWVQTGPKAFNADSHGELSASEWRTTALIRLVVTLPRLWCSRGPRYLSMLDNFMHLINAAVIATTRSVTTYGNPLSTRDLYCQEYRNYLQGRVMLYPTGKIQPTEHYAYHLGAQMEDFCPLPIASTNALERCNGMLQDIPTNRRWSDLEETMINRFCEGSNLKALTDSNIFGHVFDSFASTNETHGFTTSTTGTAILQEIRDNFHATFSNVGGSMFREVMDFHGSEYFSPKRSELEGKPKWEMKRDLMVLLMEYLKHRHSQSFSIEGEANSNFLFKSVSLEPKGWSLTQCQYYGIWFRKAKPSLMPPIPGEYTKAHKDSHIWFRSGPSKAPTAGIITDIFAYEYFMANSNANTQVFDIYFAVRTFIPLTSEEGLHDPYRKYPISGGRLYHYNIQKGAEVISIKDVICQLGVTIFERGEFPHFDGRVVHMLPLIWHHNFRP